MCGAQRGTIRVAPCVSWLLVTLADGDCMRPAAHCACWTLSPETLRNLNPKPRLHGLQVNAVLQHRLIASENELTQARADAHAQAATTTTGNTAQSPRATASAATGISPYGRKAVMSSVVPQPTFEQQLGAVIDGTSGGLPAENILSKRAVRKVLPMMQAADKMLMAQVGNTVRSSGGWGAIS
jgi:hypothetical protein